MQQRTSRINWIDIAKGIGIILVCMGHHSYGLLTDWICSFHMPLFFVASGFCYKTTNKTLLQELSHKAYRLLAAFFSYSALKWAIAVGSSFLRHSPDAHWNLLLGPILGIPGTQYISSIWFFPALFVANAVFCIFMRLLIKRNRPSLSNLILLMSLLTAFAAWIVLNGKAISFPFWQVTPSKRICLPWNADLSLYMLPYMAFGFWLREHKIMESFCQKNNWIQWLFTALLFIVSIKAVQIGSYFAGYGINYYARQFWNPIFTLFSGIIGSTFILLFCACIGNCPPIEYIGRNSALFYLLQWRFANIIADWLDAAYMWMPQWKYLIIVTTVSALIVWPICTAVSFLFPFFIGKGKIQK